MGGSHSRIDNDIMAATKEVRLELIANEHRVMITRGFEHPSGNFPVRVDDRPVRLITPRDMGEFFLDLLNLPKVYYQRNLSRILLSFNDLSRAFVIDRDFSYTEILSQMPPEQRKEVVKQMLGLTTQEIADVEEEIRISESKIQRLTDEIRGIERLLNDFQVGSLLEIEQRHANLRYLLEGLQNQEDTLRKTIEQGATAARNINAYQGSEYQTLRDELIEHRSRIQDIENETAVLTKQLQEKTELSSHLESEVDRLERHTSSLFVLSTFTFSRCPRCLQPIISEMRYRETHGDCMLCGRPLEKEREFDNEAWSKALDDAKKAVQEVQQLLEHYQTRIDIMKTEEAQRRSRVQWLQAQLARQTISYVSPLLEDLNIISERKSQVLQELSELDLEERQRRYTIKLQDESLPSLRNERDILEIKLKELQVLRGRPGIRIESFLTHFSSFMRKTASSQYRSAAWDSIEYLPLINNQAYIKALTGYDLAIAVLGFHYALLAFKVEAPTYDTAHPGLLIVDEPQQQMMEPHQYQTIMQLLMELAEKHQHNVQIVVAATNVTGFFEYQKSIELIRRG
jgi:predicted  nucleic acid-binding Zn-ribbon protein